MAKKWSKCDFKELKKLEKRLEQLEQVDWDKACQDTAKEMAQMLLSKAKKLTPTGVKPDLSAFDGQADTVEATGKYGTTRSFKSGAGVAREYWKSYRGGSLNNQSISCLKRTLYRSGGVVGACNAAEFDPAFGAAL